jgi:hypothetical protein
MKIRKLTATNQVIVWITSESHKYKKLHNRRMKNIVKKMNYTKSDYIGIFFDGAGT